MIRRLGILGILGGLGLLVFNIKAAEASTGGVQWFRYMTSGIAKGMCYSFTLNEQLIAGAINGETGPGCKFNLEAKPSGEWAHTGGFVDTPPYAWGEDKFYSTENGKFSFTCEHPEFSLDTGALPSFITLEREETIPGAGGSPNSKRYYFSVGENISDRAGRTDTFNLKLGFSTDCTMITDIEEGGLPVRRDMTPVINSESLSCKSWPETNINPRIGSLNLPVTVNGDCRAPTESPTAPPTATLVPTASPTPGGPACGEPCEPERPGDCPRECPSCPVENPVCQPEATATPRPTATPGPTATPTPIPTLPPAPCHCDKTVLLSPSDPSRIKRGDTLSFQTTGYVDDPNTTEVAYMVYKLSKDGSRIETSEHITAVPLVDPSGYYYTNWSYKIPEDEGSLGLYRVDVDLRCRYKAVSVGNGVGGWRFEAQGGMVAGAMEERGGILGIFERLWGGLRTRIERMFTDETDSVETESLAPFPTTIAGEGKSPKLGTFYPVPTLPDSGCTYYYFQVTE